MKVLFINNYPMDHAWELWKKQEYPGHHLWGVTQLHKYGIEVDILPHERYSVLKKIGDKTKVLGDLDQQLRILLQKSQYDLVYSGTDLNTSLLAFLRSIGLFKKPIIIIIHRSFPRNLLGKLFVNFFIKKHDLFLCLSNRVMEQLRDNFSISQEKLKVLPLGVDLSFYQTKRDNNSHEINADNAEFIVSAGKTDRDYNTLVKAFKEINYPLKIYGAGDSAPTIPDLPPRILVHNKQSKDPNFLSFEELLKEYQKAYAVAIPLNIPLDRADTITLIGYTSLLDAMAMGKAVVMTRNQQIDIDIEKEGIGIFVEPGDVEGWKQAISYLLEHPQETEEMGNRARSLCESRYNLDEFSSKLSEILKSVIFEKKM